jgi:hypothetical protein
MPETPVERFDKAVQSRAGLLETVNLNKSRTVGILAKALSKAQAEFPAVPKTKTAKIETRTGGSYSYKYGDLSDVVKAAAPVLSNNGLAVSQHPGWDGENDVLDTLLMHESGEWIESRMRLFLATESPQAHGSAITYAKRYAYCAAIGLVADEDDDGQVAQNAPRTASKARKASQQTLTPANPPKASKAQIQYAKNLLFKAGLEGDPDDVAMFVWGCPLVQVDLSDMSAWIETLKDGAAGVVAAYFDANPKPSREQPKGE